MNETRTVPAAALRCVVGPFELGDNGEGAKSAPFRMVARSGDSIDHWFWGRVVHDLSGMRIAKEKLAIDYAHDDRQIIGYANHFDVESGDLVVKGALVPYGDNDLASEIVYKAKAGVPYEASINFGGDGIKITEYGDGESVQVNGRTFAGPVTVISDWPLRGIAVCPYGADSNTSTSFSKQDPTVKVEVMAHFSNTEASEVTPTVDVAEALDSTVEAEGAVETVAEVVDEAATLSQPVLHTGQEYLDRFGDIGGVWFAQGKTWDESVSAHEASLLARIQELETKLANTSIGEPGPVEFTPENNGRKRGSFRDVIRIQGKHKG